MGTIRHVLRSSSSVLFVLCGSVDVTTFVSRSPRPGLFPFHSPYTRAIYLPSQRQPYLGNCTL